MQLGSDDGRVGAHQYILIPFILMHYTLYWSGTPHPILIIQDILKQTEVVYRV